MTGTMFMPSSADTSAGMLVFLPSAAAKSPMNRAAVAVGLAAALMLLTAWTDEIGATALAALGTASAILGKISSKRQRPDGWAVPVLAASAVGAAVVLALSVSLLALTLSVIADEKESLHLRRSR